MYVIRYRDILDERNGWPAIYEKKSFSEKTIQKKAKKISENSKKRSI